MLFVCPFVKISRWDSFFLPCGNVDFLIKIECNAEKTPLIIETSLKSKSMARSRSLCMHEYIFNEAELAAAAAAAAAAGEPSHLLRASEKSRGQWVIS